MLVNVVQYLIFPMAAQTKSASRVDATLRNIGHTVTDSARLISESKSEVLHQQPHHANKDVAAVFTNRSDATNMMTRMEDVPWTTDFNHWKNESKCGVKRREQPATISTAIIRESLSSLLSADNVSSVDTSLLLDMVHYCTNDLSAAEVDALFHELVVIRKHKFAATDLCEIIQLENHIAYIRILDIVAAERTDIIANTTQQIVGIAGTSNFVKKRQAANMNRRKNQFKFGVNSKFKDMSIRQYVSYCEGVMHTLVDSEIESMIPHDTPSEFTVLIHRSIDMGMFRECLSSNYKRQQRKEKKEKNRNEWSPLRSKDMLADMTLKLQQISNGMSTLLPEIPVLKASTLASDQERLTDINRVNELQESYGKRITQLETLIIDEEALERLRLARYLMDVVLNVPEDPKEYDEFMESRGWTAGDKEHPRMNKLMTMAWNEECARYKLVFTKWIVESDINMICYEKHVAEKEPSVNSIDYFMKSIKSEMSTWLDTFVNDVTVFEPTHVINWMLSCKWLDFKYVSPATITSIKKDLHVNKDHDVQYHIAMTKLIRLIEQQHSNNNTRSKL